MTTTTSTPPLARSGSAEFERIWNVVRLHFTNKWTAIGLPWAILGFIFLVNLTIWWLIIASTSGTNRANAAEGFQYNGAVNYIFVYMLVVAVQAISNTFPFALGFGVTRRDFYLGTALAFSIYSVLYGVGLTLLSYLEEWTHGWGLGGRMFTAVYFGNGPLWQRLFVFFALFLVFFITGMAFATVYVRWKGTGLTIAFAVLTLVVIGALALIGLTDNWPAVGSWLGNAGTGGVLAWFLIPTALVALAGFFVLRRATPKN